MGGVKRAAIISGALGSTASFIAKLALSPDSPAPSTIQSICIENINNINNDNDLTWICPYTSLITRGICLLCMIGVNALMISSFLDGMNESGSVVGTALSTAANFSFSAMYGIFFGEVVPLPWYLGATLIACGMWALSSVSVVEDTKETVSNKESDSSLGRGRSLRSSSESRQVSRSSSPELSVSTQADDNKGIETPNEFDVLKGRGRGIYNHEGNLKFKAVVLTHLTSYKSSNKDEKSLLAEKVVTEINEDGGMFLEKGSDGLWYETSFEEALNKTTQGTMMYNLLYIFFCWQYFSNSLFRFSFSTSHL